MAHLPTTAELAQLEEGQLRPPPSLDQDLEEGQLQRHTLGDRPTHNRCRDDGEDEAEDSDSDREFSSLLHIAAEADDDDLPAAALGSAPGVTQEIQLLRIDMPSSHQLTDTGGTQPTALWSLPLPTRPQQSRTAEVKPSHLEAASFSDSSRAQLRQQLLELSLPEQHVDAVLLERDAGLASPFSAQTVAHPTEHWIDRVMDSMYRAADPAVGTSVAVSVVPATTTAPICGICWDPIATDTDVAAPPLPSCKHVFCAACWNGYLSSKVLSNQVLLAHCPSVSPSACARILNSDEIEQHLRSNELRTQYRHLAELARISRDPTCRWCPTAGCATVLRGGSNDHPRMICPTCRSDACFTCGLPWHSDGPSATSCAEASAASLDAFLATSATLQACPGCAEALEREDGCNFIRCPRCQYEWCWLCRQHYTERHFAWWNLSGCPLLHLQSCAWAGDDACCCLHCGPWMGRLKRALLRGVLACLYALGFLVVAPFLLLASPCLIKHWHDERPARERRKQLAARNNELTRAQLQRAQLPPP